MKAVTPLMLVALLATPVSAQNQVPVVRIEEDWELHVMQPDDQIDAPQVVTGMMPFGEDFPVMFQLDVNHASYPKFNNGGLQIRATDGSTDSTIRSRRVGAGNLLVQDGEVVRWTQIVEARTHIVTFEVDIDSSSLGDFSGFPTRTYVLKSEVSGSDDTGDVTLNDYSHEVSLDNSGVAYAANRIGWFRLKSVRVYYADGAVSVNNINVDLDL